MHRVGEFIGKFADKSQGLGMYAYVMNNPILFVDPEGEETKVHIKEGDWDSNFQTIFGHALVEIQRGDESSFYSFYQDASPTAGDLRISTNQHFLEDLSEYSGDQFSTYTFNTSSSQEELIDEYYRKLNADSANGDRVYSPANYNCTDVTIESLQAGGVVSSDIPLPLINTPSKLKDLLDRKVNWQGDEHSWQYSLFHKRDLDHVMSISSKNIWRTKED